MAKAGKIRKIRFYLSYINERKWLENMALAGWFLENISFGVIFTFRSGSPKKMLYEIDRFTLPRKPTLEDIRHKEIFLDMAKQLGWEEVTHDESLTYYFAKEYMPGEINELCNDEESRRYRAEKFRFFYLGNAKELIFWSMIVMLMGSYAMVMIWKYGIEGFGWFQWFVFGYVLVCCTTALVLWKQSELCAEEMLLGRGEMEESKDTSRHKQVTRLIGTNRGLNRFLKKEEAAGWVLSGITLLTYTFDRKEGADEIYTLDSRWLTNKRLEKRRLKMLEDKKDWRGMNNDWQMQSVKDAQEKGWKFVCALENNAIIYRGKAADVKPLNDARYDKRLRVVSLIGKFGVVMLASALLGGIIGGFMGAFMY